MTSEVNPAQAGEIASPAYGFGRTLDMSMEDALARVTSALQAEGFGVLTTIDVQATLRVKLGVERTPYLILGACNPSLAHRALTAEPNVGLLLPCNVVVRALDAVDGQPRTRVEIVDPISMMGIVSDADLAAVASEARAKLEQVAAAL